MDIGGNGADHQAQIPLVRLQSRFRPFAVLDVRGKCIPVENSSLDVAHRNHADLKPAVYAIEPTEAMLDINWLAFRDRVAKDFDTVGKIVRVNHVVRLPLLCLLRRSAEILQKWSIEDLGCAIRRKAGKKARHVVQERASVEFSRTQGLLSPLAILDVYTGSTPFEDVARFIPQWIAANQEPSIGTVEAANARFRVNWGARNQTRLPLLDKFRSVVRVNRLRPPPPLCLFGSHARVIEPYLVEEVAVAVRMSSPCGRGDGIDKGGKVALARPQSLLRAGVGDSECGLIRKQT